MMLRHSNGWPIYILLMAEQSKTAAVGVLQALLHALVGSTNKKVFSGVLLAIIGYLLYMKNKKSSTDHISLKDDKNKKSVVLLVCRRAVADR